jgi:hypothetical protein
MTKMLSEADLDAAWRSVSDKSASLYHVAHARKENTDAEYDSAALRAVSASTVKRNIENMARAAKIFQSRSVPRP